MQRRRSPSASTASSIAMMCCAFICCCPELPTTQQIALALRIVCGLSVGQIARLPGQRERHGAADHPGQGADRQADIPSEPPGAAQRAERLSAVAAMIYSPSTKAIRPPARLSRRGDRRDEAPTAGPAAAQAVPGRARGHGACRFAMQYAARARIAEDGSIVLLEDQDRRLWDRAMIEEGLS